MSEDICPYGDPLCPCPDGVLCHYEGEDAWPSPNPYGTYVIGDAADRLEDEVLVLRSPKDSLERFETRGWA